METLKVKVEELIVNQDHMLNAIKYLSERLEEVTEKVNYEKSDVRELIDSQAMTDAIIVKTSDDILSIKKTKEENVAAIKMLDTKIDMIKKEIVTVRNSKNDRDITKDKSRSREPSASLKCSLCDRKFDIFWELERHIKDSHEIHNTFKCDKCEKEFVLKWRLKKHEIIHSNKISCHCHYFNNGKHCPFEELGCKFLHTASPFCKFGLTCRKKLCPFRHSRVTDLNNIDTKRDNFQFSENVKNNITSAIADVGDNFMTSTPQKKKFDCDECQQKSQCVECYVREDNESKDERSFSMTGLLMDSTHDRVQQVAV